MGYVLPVNFHLQQFLSNDFEKMDLMTALLGIFFVVFCSLGYFVWQRQKATTPAASTRRPSKPVEQEPPQQQRVDPPADAAAIAANVANLNANRDDTDDTGPRRPARAAARARLRAAAQNRAEREQAPPEQDFNNDDDDNAVPTGGRNLLRRHNDAGVGGGRRGSNVDDEDDVPDIADIPEFDKNGNRIGTKKRKKMEAKAERRAMVDAEMQYREERKKTQEERDERRRRDEERVEAEEQKRLDEERRIREEKEKKELEEYLEIKTAFEIEDEGQDEAADDAGSGLNDFIAFIQSAKVVAVEDLAAHFKLKVQDCVSRIEQLVENGTLTGVLDERGKFIFITQAELLSVADFIREKGRVRINELVEHSNRLINLEQPKSNVAVA